MKYSRKCLVCDKEVISSNKRTFVHPECKDRPTPPVQAKTAEEIKKVILSKIKELKTFMHNEDDSTIRGNYYVSIQHMYGLIRDFDAQFIPSSKSVEVEEAEWINPDQQLNGADFLIEVNKILKTYPNTSLIKIAKLYIKQQQKQADTISRLTESLKTIYSLAKPGSAIYDICDKTLNQKK